MWLAYFIYWGGAAAVLPFMSVFYESVNLKGGQIGQLNSIPYFVSLISSISFSFLSDVLRSHKLVLRMCIFGLIAVLLVFPSLSTFAAFLPVVLLYSVFSSPANPILDQTALSALKNPENYGKIRVGGSIGWSIMVLVSGYLIDHLHVGLPVIFYINIAFLVLFYGMTAFMPEPRREVGSDAEKVSPGKLAAMLRLPGFLIFLLTIIIWGIGESSIGSFMFLHIKSLGGSTTLMGIALSVSVIGEIIIFSYSDKIQSRLGPQKMILGAFLVLLAWLAGLALIRNPNAIPLFQVFGGAGFGLLQSGSVAYVNERAPKGLGTTAQAIRVGLFSGLGVGIGAIISGIMYEASGSVILFRNMALIVLVGFFFALLVYMIDRRKRLNQS